MLMSTYHRLLWHQGQEGRCLVSVSKNAVSDLTQAQWCSTLRNATPTLASHPTKPVCLMEIIRKYAQICSGSCHQSNTITNYLIWWGISIYLAFFTQISRFFSSDTPLMQTSSGWGLKYNVATLLFAGLRPISLQTNNRHYERPWLDATCVRGANSFVTRHLLSQEQNELICEKYS